MCAMSYSKFAGKAFADYDKLAGPQGKPLGTKIRRVFFSMIADSMR